MNFVNDSPKREASFASFSRLEEHSGSVGLRPLSSTRWVCREPALKSFVHNYEGLLKWFAEPTTEGCVSDKRVALGYFNSLRKFKNYFSILLLQKIFTTVHWTHLAIQKPNLSVTNARRRLVIYWLYSRQNALPRPEHPAIIHAFKIAGQSKIEVSESSKRESLGDGEGHTV